MDVTKGLHIDFNESNQPASTYRWAMDWVAENYDSLTTELGNIKVENISTATNSPLDRGYKPVGFIPKQNSIICFFTNGVESEIGVYIESTNTYYPYLTSDNTITGFVPATELNFSENYTVRGLSKSNNEGDWVVVFNDRLNSPKIITIDSVNFDITKYYPNYNVNQIELFPFTNNTEITSSIAEGGQLDVAPYIAFVQHERLDGTTSSLYSDNKIHSVSQQNTYSKDSGSLGSISKKSIEVTFTPDVKWYKVNVGLCNLHTGVCYIVTSRYIQNPTSGITVTLNTFSGILVEGGLDNINVLKTNYIKAHTQTSHQGYLYLGNMEKTSLDIPQKVINTLGLKWICKWVDATEENKTFKSFQPNEVYAFFIRFWKDGVVSNWYLMKGREPHAYKTLAKHTYEGANIASITTAYQETDFINSVTINHDNLEIINGLKDKRNDEKIFHYNDCIDKNTLSYSIVFGTETIKGEFSYWENEGEVYNNYFKGEDLDVGATSGALDSLNMRLFKFPSKHFLNLATCEPKNGILPEGETGASLNTGSVYHVPLHDKYNYFTYLQPQLGVEFVNSADLTTWIADNIQGDFDKIEIGYSKRDINNITVIGEDLAAFGVYSRNVSGGYDGTGNFHPNVDLGNSYSTEALGFTGANMNPINHYTSNANSSLNNSASWQSGLNGSFYPDITNITVGNDPVNAAEMLPNYQRIFNPEIINDTDITKSLALTPSYIRHEVLLSTMHAIREVAQSAYFDVGTYYSATPAQIATSFPAISYTFQSAVPSPDPYNNVGRMFGFILDYTFKGISALDYNRGLPLGIFKEYDINEGISTAQFTAGTNTVVYNKSDFAYPTRFVFQSLEESYYLAKGLNTELDGAKPLNGVVDGGAYGGNNTLILKINTDLTGITPVTTTNALSGSTYFPIGTITAPTPLPSVTASIDYNVCTRPIFTDVTNAAPVSGYYHTWRDVSNIKHEMAYAMATGESNTNPLTTYFFSVWHPFPSLGTFTRRMNNSFLTTLCIDNKFIHSNLLNKVIEVCEIDDDTYVGDVFISEVTYKVDGFSSYGIGVGTGHGGTDAENWYGGGINSCIYRFFAHTRQNQNLRKKLSDTLTLHNSTFSIEKTIEYYRCDTNKCIPQGYNLDDIWSLGNINYLQSSIYNSYDLFQNKFPFRIVQSSVNAKESTVENWTNFPILNYYEMDKANGEISNLQGYDEQLLIQTINTLLITKSSTGLKADTFSVVLGTGNIFDFPPNQVLVDNISGGYVGTKHQASCLLTPFGYFSYDVSRRRFYQYVVGALPKEISISGLRLFFEKYGDIEIDDFISGRDSVYLAYDHTFRRIIFTFKSKVAERHFTISYYPETESWKSFHHYTPVLLFNTKNNLYGVKNETGELFVFNQPNSFSEYADSQIESIIDIVHNTIPIVGKDGITRKGGLDSLKIMQNFNWKSEVRNGGTENYNILETETFTNALVRTNKQASKDVDLVFLQNTRKWENVWQFNAFRDAVERNLITGEPLTGNVVNTIIDDFSIVGNTLTNPVKRFIDTFAVLRLKYLTNENKRLTLWETDWSVKTTKK